MQNIDSQNFTTAFFKLLLMAVVNPSKMVLAEAEMTNIHLEANITPQINGIGDYLSEKTPKNRLKKVFCKAALDTTDL